MVAFNKNCHILAFSLVFCLFLHDATSITVGQVVIQIKNQNSQNLCGLHSSADFIFFFSQKLRITFECGLNSSAGCFRVNTVQGFCCSTLSRDPLFGPKRGQVEADDKESSINSTLASLQKLDLR